jgi:hyaluronan synthase
MYVVSTAVMTWLRALRWFDTRTDDESSSERAITFALAPLYALLHLFVLLPLRVFAVATLRTRSWGTRGSIEVALAGGEVALQPISWRAPDTTRPVFAASHG